nr:odorant-binding protein 14 [Lytta caraganae]
MKFIFVLVAIVALSVSVQALTDQQKEEIKALQKKCTEATGVDEQLAKKARQGTFEDDAKLKKYLLCFLKHLGGVDEQGNFQKDALKTKIEPMIGADKTGKILSECLNKKATPEDSAFEYAKCAYKYRPSEGYPTK